MELFCFDDDVGPGLPLWLPKGAVLIEELEKLAKETEFAAGYQRVRTPHIARESMYVCSGHLPYYAESMFPPMELVADANAFSNIDLSKTLDDLEKKIFESNEPLLEELASPGSEQVTIKDATESFWAKLRSQDNQLDETARKAFFLRILRRLQGRIDRYYLKAMNCPHHHKIFGAVPRSYRELPLRLAEYGNCYRYEQSGELFGLMRVRSMQMNDAHIYCTEDQFEAEFNAVNQMYLKYFKIFGIDKYLMRFSTHDPEKVGQKFVGEPELWIKTEEMVRNVLKRSGINYVEVANEAAFYGPKIDVQVWSAIGREFTIATNQVDFAVPKRFGLVYKDRDNTEKTPLCIHRAPLGTHERFIGFLIEHYAGNFPLWLAPEQVRILTIGDEEPLVEFAKSIHDELRSHEVRADLDLSTDKINGKFSAPNSKKFTRCS
jgi:threonyl-tRNA synthetase